MDRLIKEDKNTGEITTYKHDPLDNNSLSSDRVYSIYRDRKGNLWIGTYGGLDILNEETNKFIHFKDIIGNQNNLSSKWVWPIFEDSNGIMWFGEVRGGLNRFDPKSKTLTNYKNISTNPSSLSHNFLFSIYEDRSGVIWMGAMTAAVPVTASALKMHEPRMFPIAISA